VGISHGHVHQIGESQICDLDHVLVILGGHGLVIFGGHVLVGVDSLIGFHFLVCYFLVQVLLVVLECSQVEQSQGLVGGHFVVLLVVVLLL
jgi:hypothetical protein